MRGFTHSVSFTDLDVNLTNNRLSLQDHRFDDGEEVVYLATGTPIGIGSTNVGFSTNKLVSQLLVILLLKLITIPFLLLLVKREP